MCQLLAKVMIFLNILLRAGVSYDGTANKLINKTPFGRDGQSGIKW